MESELKPCPWCGLPMQIYRIAYEGYYHVAHAEPFTCPMEVRIYTDWSEKVAINAWNTRAEQKEQEK